jgi:hypothetical protein
MVGVFKKWKPLKILLNSKLSNIILHFKSRTKVKGDSWFFYSINKKILKIGSNLKSIIT